ncbi:baseplate J/gp47 family protein [Brevibacillus sp. SYSU BS000544]|uniref:baseplate J/gp47 family protein n=1 Tax=Brevibacillus sp. SYSU BS000544 TaxID=3416443 RepID=UPI003CE49161
MATLEKPEMPILRETPEQIYQRMVNRLTAMAEKRGETAPATAEGEIFYDLLFPIAAEISEQQQLLEYAFLQGFVPWADGEYLDAHGFLIGLARNTNETDEAYRMRLIERARLEEGNGRRIDYEQWARQISGVGGAVAIEKKRHDLSIDVYITDSNGQPSTPEFAQQVREIMENKRIALHDLQVHPAVVFAVNISVKIKLLPGSDQAAVLPLITKRINNYLKGRALVVYQQLGALFLVDGVQDYSQFTLNGGTSNLTVPDNAVSVLMLGVTS